MIDPEQELERVLRIAEAAEWCRIHCLGSWDMGFSKEWAKEHVKTCRNAFLVGAFMFSLEEEALLFKLTFPDLIN